MTKLLFLKLIKLYQKILSGRWSFLNLNCKFHPTCSEYGYRVIERFGVCKGLAMSVKRIARCNPWSKGGIDEVPELTKN